MLRGYLVILSSFRPLHVYLSSIALKIVIEVHNNNQHLVVLSG